MIHFFENQIVKLIHMEKKIFICLSIKKKIKLLLKNVTKPLFAYCSFAEYFLDCAVVCARLLDINMPELSRAVWKEEALSN